MPPYKLLEQKYANFVGSKYAVSCNSGTSAIHLALLAIGIGKGDEVIVPDFTMAACGFAVSYTGAKPVFVDCDDTLCIDWKLIEKKITKKTKAIMVVHIYGRLCNMKEILRIAKKHKLKVIEDACEAQGAVYKSKADITCYSFYENKIIHAEEGGICTTDSPDYTSRMNYYKNMCFDEGHTYFHANIGYNYRMANSQAVLALKSLQEYPQNKIWRRELERNYNKTFDIKQKRAAVWVYDIRLPFTKFKNEVVISNKNNTFKIPVEFTRPFFKPLSSFPMYGGKCQSPKAKYYSEKGFYIKL